MGASSGAPGAGAQPGTPGADPGSGTAGTGERRPDGHFRLAVESWAPGFGAPVDAGELEPTPGQVDIDAEVPAAAWRPRRPDGEAPAADVVFIDGVRRIDARVWITTAAGTRPGLCVSYAAGTVRCDGAARVETVEVRRVLLATAGAPEIVTAGGRWRPLAAGGDDLETLVGRAQECLRELEVEVATGGVEAGLVVVDGPLWGRQGVPGAVGYVKTHRVGYLPEAVTDVVADLKPGERTPLFVTQTTWSRYSWYLRLPGGDGHPWAGVVRCEASADLPLDAVARLADRTAATLPRFASQPHKDPRAPQNLYPIAGLERELRRRLGDPALLERQLRAAAAATPRS